LKAAQARRISAPHVSTPLEVVWQALLREKQRLQLARQLSFLNFATGAEFWQHITRNSSAETYMHTPNVTPYVPFVADQMAEPSLDAGVVPMLEASPPEIATKYMDVQQMLLPREQIPLDPRKVGRRYRQVLGPRTEWIRYLQRPEVEPLWELLESSQVRATLSVAAVPKSGKPGLRKILMSVPFNNLAGTPAQLLWAEVDYGLAGGAALSQIYVPICWHTRTIDQSNAFTHSLAPSSWWAYMAAPPVRAYELPVRWTRGRWKKNQKLYLGYRRLGMGHTHAGFILMEINKAVTMETMRHNAPFARAAFLNDLRTRAFRVSLGDFPW